MRVVPCFALVAATVAGCGQDLGTCNMKAATQVVYASDGTPYYAGQGLVDFSCAEGVCHSSLAEHGSRKGAPYGLNFDVRPLSSQSTPDNVRALRDGLANVRDEADDMWGEIAEGSMPPGEAGKRADQHWKRADGKAAGLPGLSTDVGKATVRNWLACGAPVISGVTGASAEAESFGTVMDPLDVSSSEPGGTPSFATVFDTVFSQCNVCHMSSGPYASLGLDMSSMDAAYRTLIDKMPAEGGEAKCGDFQGKIIEPGDCQGSLIYLKLSADPPCGARMPLGTALSDSALQALCDWIDAGAEM